MTLINDSFGKRQNYVMRRYNIERQPCNVILFNWDDTTTSITENQMCQYKTQISLADDEKMRNIKIWQDWLVSQGRKYSYCINKKKSSIILKSEALLEFTKNLLSRTGIKITTKGGCFTLKWHFSWKICQWCCQKLFWWNWKTLNLQIPSHRQNVLLLDRELH